MFFFQNIQAQKANDLATKISNTSCDCINKLKKEDMSKASVSSCVQKSYKKYQSDIVREVGFYQNKNPNTTTNDASTYIQRLVGGELIMSCPKYHSFLSLSMARELDVVSDVYNHEYIDETVSLICECINKVDKLTQKYLDDCKNKSIDTNSTEYIYAIEKDPKLDEEITKFLELSCEKYSKFMKKSKRKKK